TERFAVDEHPDGGAAVAQVYAGVQFTVITANLGRHPRHGRGARWDAGGTRVHLEDLDAYGVHVGIFDAQWRVVEVPDLSAIGVDRGAVLQEVAQVPVRTAGGPPEHEVTACGTLGYDGEP